MLFQQRQLGCELRLQVPTSLIDLGILDGTRDRIDLLKDIFEQRGFVKHEIMTGLSFCGD